jgi:phage-related protein
MEAFPVFSDMTEDASILNVEREDNALRAPTDGGYEFTRPRSTRRQRKTFSTGFTSLSHLNYLAMCAFYDAHETSLAFTYIFPPTGEVKVVRFAEPMSDKWTGVGTTNLWDVKIKLKEV